jgi:putative DNA primase/helicase
MALWGVHTHAFKVAEASPRLALISPLPECGKTTALSLLGRLVARPLIASNVTTAALYRVIERDHPTLLVDELDSFMDMRDELAGIMNSGHTRQSAYVVRCVGETHEPTHFSTWAPLAIARIGDLPPALRSRSVIIEMQRARPDEEIERLRPMHHPGLDELARKAARWARDNLNALLDPDPKMPGDMSGRTADNWRALLAIADQAGGHWLESARRAAVRLSSGDELSPGVELLVEVLRVFNAKGVDRLSSDELSKSIGKSSARIPPSPRKLARALKPFGIRPRVIRTEAGTPRGYLRAEIEDAVARYAPPSDDGPAPPS